MIKFLPVPRIVFLFAVIGLAVGLAVSYLITPKWEAVSVINQAHIVNPSISSGVKCQKDQNLEPMVLIESYDVLMTRFRAPSVLQAVIEANKLSDDPGAFKQLLKDTRIALLSNAIELRVRAITPEAAKSTSEQYLIKIAADQAALIEKTNLKNIDVTPIAFAISPSTAPYPVTPQPLLILVISVSLATALGFFVALICAKTNLN